MNAETGYDSRGPSPRDAVLARVIDALARVESGGRADAVGDDGRAVGLLQMWTVAVDEANRLAELMLREAGHPAHVRIWKYGDRLNPAMSRAMARVILGRHYDAGVTDAVELGCRWRNPDGKAPSWYRDRVRSALNAG